jgi:hypothetical protein
VLAPAFLCGLRDDCVRRRGCDTDQPCEALELVVGEWGLQLNDEMCRLACRRLRTYRVAEVAPDAELVIDGPAEDYAEHQVQARLTGWFGKNCSVEFSPGFGPGSRYVFGHGGSKNCREVPLSAFAVLGSTEVNSSKFLMGVFGAIVAGR